MTSKSKCLSSFGGPTAYWGTSFTSPALLGVATERRAAAPRVTCASLFCHRAHTSIFLSLHHYLWFKETELHRLLATGIWVLQLCKGWITNHSQPQLPFTCGASAHCCSGSTPFAIVSSGWIKPHFGLSQGRKNKVTQSTTGATQTRTLKSWPTSPCQALQGTDPSVSDRNSSVECMKWDKGNPCISALCLLCSYCSKHRLRCRTQWCATVLFFQ